MYVCVCVCVCVWRGGGGSGSLTGVISHENPTFLGFEEGAAALRDLPSLAPPQRDIRDKTQCLKQYSCIAPHGRKHVRYSEKL